MTKWQLGKEYTDITYRKADGMARVAFDPPEICNALRLQTIDEMIDAFRDASMASKISKS